MGLVATLYVMATDPLADLRSKIEELQNLDLDKLRNRTLLFGARIDLEDLAGGIAETVDMDVDIVLLVTRAAWMVRLEEDVGSSLDTPDPIAFNERVKEDVRLVLDAISNAQPSTGCEVADRALAKTLELGRAGVKIIPVREIMDRARCMIQRPV